MRKPFDIPHTWKDHYTKYPHGYSVMEMLADWATKAGKMSDELDNKTPLTGDHKGTWRGLTPTQADQTIGAVVDGIYKDTYPLIEFGAVGDGVHDDTSALQMAINYCTSAGRALVIDKEYKITSPLLIHSNTCIIGNGGKIISSANYCFLVDKDVINVFISSLNVVNLGASDGGFDQAIFLYSEPYVGSISNSFIINNTIEGFGLGLSIEGKGDNPPRGINGQYPTTLAGTGFNKIINNTIRNSLAVERIGTGGGHGIFCRGAYFHVIGNHIISMQGGVLGASHSIVSGNTIIDCYDDNGVYVNGGEYVVVSNNYIENTKADGVAVSGASHVNVSNNIIIKSGNGAIRIQGSSFINITGNNVVAPYNHFIRGVTNSSTPPSNKINITGNTFEGRDGQMGANPVFIPDPVSPYSNPFKDILISDNIFANIDTSGLDGPFYGPYAIINGGNIPTTILLKDNIFTDITKTPVAPARNQHYLFRNVKEDNNVITFKDGDVINTGEKEGRLLINIGADGAIANKHVNGVVADVAKGVDDGVYIVTLTRPISIDKINWSTDLSNRADEVRIEVPNPSSTAGQYLDTLTFTLYKDGAPFTPSYNSRVMVEVGTIGNYSM